MRLVLECIFFLFKEPVDIFSPPPPPTIVSSCITKYAPQCLQMLIHLLAKNNTKWHRLANPQTPQPWHLPPTSN